MNTITRAPLYRPLLRIMVCTAMLLLIPCIASQFTQEVNWTARDYFSAAVLLVLTGFGYTLSWRMVKSRYRRVTLVVFITLLLLFIWAHLAVGIF